MADGHIRVNADLNERLKALVEVTKRSVTKEGEIALENHLTEHADEVEEGRKLIKKAKK